MTTLVIGDIHGCLNTLKALIEKAGPVDRIISCGDLIDRGPESLATIKYVRDNNIDVVLGNHELMCIDAMRDYLGPEHPYQRMGLVTSDWYANGGKQVFESSGSREVMEDIVEYFSTLPIYIQLDYTVNGLPVVVSHTCLNNYHYDILNASNDDLKKHAVTYVWSRSQAVNSAKIFSVYGHTPTDYLGVLGSKPMIAKTGINLDTGCCYASKDRGKLTGIIFPSQDIIQQEYIG